MALGGGPAPPACGSRLRYILGAAGPQYPAPSDRFHVAAACVGQTPLDLLPPLRADVYLLQGLHRADVDELGRHLRSEWQLLPHFPGGGEGAGDAAGDAAAGEGAGVAVAVRAALWRVESSSAHALGDLMTDDERADWRGCAACRAVLQAPRCCVVVAALRHRHSGAPLIVASARLANWHSEDTRPAQGVQALLVLRAAAAAAEAAGAECAALGGEWNAAEGSAAERLLHGEEVGTEDAEHPGQVGWVALTHDPLRPPARACCRPAPAAPPAAGAAPPLLLRGLTAWPLGPGSLAPVSAHRVECAFPPGAAPAERDAHLRKRLAAAGLGGDGVRKLPSHVGAAEAAQPPDPSVSMRPPMGESLALGAQPSRLGQSCVGNRQSDMEDAFRELRDREKRRWLDELAGVKRGLQDELRDLRGELAAIDR